MFRFVLLAVSLQRETTELELLLLLSVNFTAVMPNIIFVSADSENQT